MSEWDLDEQDDTGSWFFWTSNRRRTVRSSLPLWRRVEDKPDDWVMGSGTSSTKFVTFMEPVPLVGAESFPAGLGDRKRGSALGESKSV
jgi:hypothetical protein